ncbi:hypothetical protein DCS32_09780 [Dokdonia sp. Dokd-P16]|uniref:DUF5683 domain-containing protein n=1 Tax=Dokdonia sp. Dokd-P16 TaxID=2173169 RepID=UPI000D549E25|nr:DUF5683 domain-containing protein [Dokdonia sp. Dokd-P16]AWH74436.1 hypothetical protein DCS32_09780 [Dokdonia sp. Dokd-P16]
MKNNKYLLLVFLLCFYAFAKAQQDAPAETIIDADEVEGVSSKKPYDPLRPAKAAFYGAVLPGLGQIYNKDYWKLPLVYGALGSTIYGVSFNGNQSERFRTAFKERLAGRIDEFTRINEDGTTTEIFSDDALINGQDQFRRRRDLFILVSAGVYILQIIEANVDAHLSQYDVDDDLTFGPALYFDDLGQTMNYGLSFNYKF